MAYTKFIFDERNELVRRVLATENIWQLRENVIIQRETEEPPLSPLDIEINIKKWNELQQSNNRSPRSPEVHQRNTKFKAMPNDKENSATKSDRRRSNFECGFIFMNCGLHIMCKDAHGRVLCPRLRAIVCPICHDTGENAHTIKYCPNDKKTVFQDGFRL